MGCVRKAWKRKEADAEVERLTKEYPKFLWYVEACYKHKGFHVIRKDKEKENTEPDWTGKCENCGASPIVPATGMCGPCTFGDADTVDGNW